MHFGGMEKWGFKTDLFIDDMSSLRLTFLSIYDIIIAYEYGVIVPHTGLLRPFCSEMSDQAVEKV